MSYYSSHALARAILAKPDMPVAVGKHVGIFQAGPTEFRIHPSGRLLFDDDPKVPSERLETVFWITGSGLI